MVASLALCVLLQFFAGVIVSVRAFGQTVFSENQYIADTGYAKYQGLFTPPHTVSYLGVPYAEPPVGENRFRRPVVLDTERLRKIGGVTNARSYPDFCIQGSTGNGDAGGAGAEDCLKVNIYAPSNATSQSRLPVLFYIHGGGYVYGNPRNWPFEHWINQSPNVVIVSVYYRLDTFGFLSHPAFSSDPSLGDYNVGLQDQTLALRWVKENIASFGGDPNKVTINGESSGGGSVELLLVANVGEKLFSGAIAQSVDRDILPAPDDQVTLFNFFATKAGCGDNIGSIESTMNCLRSASISAIARAQDANFTESSYNKWRPVIDGTIIPDFPTKLLINGRFAHVPTIAGSTSNETLYFGTDAIGWIKSEFPLLTTEDLDEFSEVYDPAQFSSEEEWSATAVGEPTLRCGREVIANATMKFAKTWTYRYNQPNPTSGNPGFTGHAAENWMMFRGTNTGTNGSTVFTDLNRVETAFSTELIAYWLSFVRAGDPNTFKLSRSPVWPDYSTDKRIVLQQDPNNSTVHTGNYVEREPDGEVKRCTFLASKYAHMQD